MSFIKKILSIFIFFSIFGCGYTPLISDKKNNLYIEELLLEGDRQVNSYLDRKLKKHKKFSDNSKIYKIYISSKYEKSVVNKVDDGNPKNYNIKIILKSDIKSDKKNETKIFERSVNFSSKDKKIEEKESEKQIKKDLSNLLGDDLIFYLITN